MKVLGLITEYNPFHNGHKYHLEKSLEKAGCDIAVCVMSGNFIQRGQPALINKWARTEMALKNGVDLVIELPVYYALASAEFFAFGAIKILDSLGIIDSVCFGSECGDIESLKLIANILVEQPESFRTELAKYLSQGLSFPKARSLALIDFFKGKSVLNANSIEQIIEQPNNILGIEYVKALTRLDSQITPFTIKRYGTGHHSEDQYENISSATAIRKTLESNNCEALKQVVPQNVSDIIKAEFKKGRGQVFTDGFSAMIISQIRKSSPEDIQKIIDVSEGIENRIKNASQISGSISNLLNIIKTKRYTSTRLQRILFHILLGHTSDLFDKFNNNGGPQYARILGFSEKGKELLSQIKMPLVTSPAAFLKNCTDIQREMLEADILASDIYSLAYQMPEQRLASEDFHKKIITV